MQLAMVVDGVVDVAPSIKDAADEKRRYYNKIDDNDTNKEEHTRNYKTTSN